MILSDYYDLPFNDILNWKKFSVILKEKDVYQLKQILKKITQEEFDALHNNLVKVRLAILPQKRVFIVGKWGGEVSGNIVVHLSFCRH